MKNLLRAISMLFVLSTGTHAAEKYGFQTVPFGTSYEDVSLYLLEKYGLHSSLIRQPTLTLPDEGRMQTIIFKFTTDSKFYGLLISTLGRDIEDLDKAEMDSEFLVAVMKKKYGPKYVCRNKTGKFPRLMLCEWAPPELYISTSPFILRGDSIPTIVTYVASISSQKYAKKEFEHKQRQQEQKRSEEHTS